MLRERKKENDNLSEGEVHTFNIRDSSAVLSHSLDKHKLNTDLTSLHIVLTFTVFPFLFIHLYNSFGGGEGNRSIWWGRDYPHY
jgi:hypothetical protein